MGTAICIQGYEKESSCITGEIKIFGLYEASSDIENYKIAGTEAVLYNDLESIPVVKEGEYHYGYGYEEIKNLLFFYDTIPSGYDGWGLRSDDEEFYTVMFEPSKILTIVVNLLSIYDNYSKYLREKDTEFEELNLLKETLEVIVKKNGIVKLFWG